MSKEEEKLHYKRSSFPWIILASSLVVAFVVLIFSFISTTSTRKSEFEAFKSAKITEQHQIKKTGNDIFALQNSNIELFFPNEMLNTVFADIKGAGSITTNVKNDMVATINARKSALGKISEITLYSTDIATNEYKCLLSTRKTADQVIERTCSTSLTAVGNSIDVSLISTVNAEKIGNTDTMTRGTGYDIDTYYDVYLNMTSQNFDPAWKPGDTVQHKGLIKFKISELAFLTSLVNEYHIDKRSDMKITNKNLSIMHSSMDDESILGSKAKIDFEREGWEFFNEEDGTTNVTKENFTYAINTKGNDVTFITSPRLTTISEKDNFNYYVIETFNKSELVFANHGFFSIIFSLGYMLIFFTMIIIVVSAWTISSFVDRNRYFIRKTQDVEKFIDHMVEFSENVTYADDEGTAEHISRITQFTDLLIAETAELDPKYKAQIVKNAKMHDIGKLTVDKDIINKPGTLTDDEFEKIKKHTINGADFASSLGMDNVAINIIKHHHENYDGSGYPDGLKGDQIPLEARIIRIVDTYDALKETRAYKSAWPEMQVRKYLIEHKGSLFDPKLVDKFISRLPKLSEEELKAAKVGDTKIMKQLRAGDETLNSNDGSPKVSKNSLNAKAPKAKKAPVKKTAAKKTTTTKK